MYNCSLKKIILENSKLLQSRGPVDRLYGCMGHVMLICLHPTMA